MTSPARRCERPELAEAYREMDVPAGPSWVDEHLKRLLANGIQPHFQLATIAQLETVERLIRRGAYTGPLNLTWVAIGGGFDGPNPYNMMNFIQRVPDGATLTLETLDAQRAAASTRWRSPWACTPAAATRTTSGASGPARRSPRSRQIEQLVRIAEELGRDVATGKEAREIYKLDEHCGSADETLAKIGFAPNRKPGQVGFTFHA